MVILNMRVSPVTTRQRQSPAILTIHAPAAATAVTAAPAPAAPAGVGQRLERGAGATRQRAAEELAAGVVSFVTRAVGALNADLGDLAKVGLVLSSARAGLKRVAVVPTGGAAGRRRFDCFLTTALQGEELVLFAERLGHVRELARVALTDPAAATTLQAAAEQFLLETAERLSRGAA